MDIILDITDDNIAELEETISISLRASIPGVTLKEAESTQEVVVHIQDNEGKPMDTTIFNEYNKLLTDW